MGFSQLRLAHFHDVLGAAGHAVRLVTLGAEDTALGASDAWAGHHHVREEGPGWLDAVRHLADGADVLVSAGPYNPGRAVCLAATDQPVWADLPGDPFAELQALTLAGPVSGERVAAAQAAALPVLLRADALSTVSGAQRLAAVGQLGLLGRLVGPEPQERVFVVPVAWSFPGEPVPPCRRAAGEALVAVVSGGFNSWFDHDTLVSGLDEALRACPGLRVLCTGGAVPGLPDAGFRAFARWAAGWGDRVRLSGWLPQARLGLALAGAHVGLCLDRAGYEPELGSRTRVLWYAWSGLRVLATPRTELVRELAHGGLVDAVPTGDARAFAAALTRLYHQPLEPEVQARLAHHLRARFAPELAAAPLLDWVAAPWRLPDTGASPLAAAGALALEVARLRQALAEVHATPTWRLSARVDRLRRRLRSRVGGGADRR